jgi:hypothetical protein
MSSLILSLVSYWGAFPVTKLIYYFVGGGGQQARKADNLAAICESIVFTFYF